MTDPRFIHLRLHTEYSVADGLVRVDEAVKRAKGIAMPALGLSVLSNTFGWVKFYRAARGAGIKPVFGDEPCGAAFAAARNRDDLRVQVVRKRRRVLSRHPSRAVDEQSESFVICRGHCSKVARESASCRASAFVSTGSAMARFTVSSGSFR